MVGNFQELLITFGNTMFGSTLYITHFFLKKFGYHGDCMSSKSHTFSSTHKDHRSNTIKGIVATIDFMITSSYNYLMRSQIPSAIRRDLRLHYDHWVSTLLSLHLTT